MATKMQCALMLLLCCLWGSLWQSVASTASKYVVVVDLGSSGSRAFVYQFHPDGRVTGSKGLKVLPGISEIAEARDFGRAATYLAPLFNHTKHVVPSELHSSTPIYLRATAGMRLLPAEVQLELFDTLYTDLVEKRTRPGSSRGEVGDCPFLLKRSHISTIEGEEEAYFAGLSANYLSGTVDSALRLRSSTDGEGQKGEENEEQQPRNYVKPLGALDLGGASTQIVFAPTDFSSGDSPFPTEVASSTTQCSSTISCSPGVNDAQNCSSPLSLPFSSSASASTSTNMSADPRRVPTNDGVLDRKDFLARSYLGFGADQIRLRLWKFLFERADAVGTPRAKAKKEEAGDATWSSTPSDDWTAREVENPCGFAGQVIDWRGGRLLGTGRADECAQLVQDLLFADCGTKFDLRSPSAAAALTASPPLAATPAQPPRLGCPMGGFPSLPSVRGVRFVAMSVYFFALDCLRELGPHAVRQVAQQHAKTDGDGAGTEEAAAAAHVALEAHWPSPSLEVIRAATRAFCSMEWNYIETELRGLHKWTWDHQMPHRCFEVVAINTLLRDGWGFDAGASFEHVDGLQPFGEGSGPISFAVEVAGMELEWTLGYALASETSARTPTIAPLIF